MQRSFALPALALCALAVPALAGGSDVQVIVKFKGDADVAKVKSGGGAVVHTIDGLDAVVARIAPGKIAALRADPSIAYVEEDGICEALAKGGNGKKPGGGGGDTSTPPPQETPWGVIRVRTDGHDLPNTWTERGAGVKVAVVDTGIDYNHPDLAANVKGHVSRVSFGKTTDGLDDNGHGSHVAGTIGAVDNTEGVVGVAPDVSLYAVKVLDRRGSGTWGDVADGILWCKNNGMNIANMSLGGGNNSTVEGACTSASSSVLLIAAAGNSGDGNTSTNEWSYPAAYSTVVSVGATTSTDTLASFSNSNPDVEVSGPGYKVPSTYKNGGYATLSGTSMATPHAVGVAALYWAATNGNAGTVRSALTAGADNSMFDPSTDDANGYGAGIVEY